jgi:hypothetical protein
MLTDVQDDRCQANLEKAACMTLWKMTPRQKVLCYFTSYESELKNGTESVSSKTFHETSPLSSRWNSDLYRQNVNIVYRYIYTKLS